ncbi:MAG: hypothetical protein LQ340_008106 [Diploschistes diacapsis]|nr:MAG: hypothetical protein LQ340_008106 [Diploschistes diacapsis]
MRRLDVRWRWKKDTGIGVGFAAGNVWSRAARRKREKERREKGERMDVDGNGDGDGDGDDDDDEEDGEKKEPALGFKITVNDAEGEKGVVEVGVRWLVGMDSVLFESFCGMVKRELGKDVES